MQIHKYSKENMKGTHICSFNLPIITKHGFVNFMKENISRLKLTKGDFLR
jgi:hypothetical protein